MLLFSAHVIHMIGALIKIFFYQTVYRRTFLRRSCDLGATSFIYFRIERYPLPEYIVASTTWQVQGKDFTSQNVSGIRSTDGDKWVEEPSSTCHDQNRSDHWLSVLVKSHQLIIKQVKSITLMTLGCRPLEIISTNDFFSCHLTNRIITLCSDRKSPKSLITFLRSPWATVVLIPMYWSES